MGVKPTHRKTIEKEDRIIMESAKIAFSKAVRSSSALGLTMKFIEDNHVIEVTPDGKSKKIKKIAKSKIDISNLKKGMILERK